MEKIQAVEAEKLFKVFWRVDNSGTWKRTAKEKGPQGVFERFLIDDATGTLMYEYLQDGSEK